MQISFNGRRKNFVMLFIAFLVGLILILKKKAATANPKAPTDLRLAALSNKLTNYENWLAVARYETAGFTSGAYTYANNPWGMHNAKIRPEYQDGTYQGSTGEKVAKYIDLNNAVLDLIEWIDYTNFPIYELNLAEHIEEMKKRNYFPDSSGDYLAGVLAWQKR